MRPKACEGLLSSDHSKRGKRFVTILDLKKTRVTLLEAWEHAILVLCDGTRDASAIASLLVGGVDGESVDTAAIGRAFQLFERQSLIERTGLGRPEELSPPGPKTLAQLQAAYEEWHKAPVKTGQVLVGISPPISEPRAVDLPVGLEPTVVLNKEGRASDPRARVAVGSTLVLSDVEATEARSVQEDRDVTEEEDGEDELAVEDVAVLVETVVRELAAAGSVAAGTAAPGTVDAPKERQTREVFERLRRAGYRPRQSSPNVESEESELRRPIRTRNESSARRFDEALRNLIAGDLDLALAHFRALLKEVPASKRLVAFVEVIESVQSGHGGGTIAGSLVADFEGLLKDAIAAGRCPQCLTVIENASTACLVCGFVLSIEEGRMDRV